MNFFSNLFNYDINNNYVISGLNNELISINIYDAFINNDKSFLLLTDNMYNANLFYQKIRNYTDLVLLFPMDDFLTSEAVAISPEFKIERISTLNKLVNDNHYIVVTCLMGVLRYLPSFNDWKNCKINITVGNDLYRTKFLKDLNRLGYERVSIVNGMGQYAVRGFVIDLFPIDFENPIRLEFWGDTVDSIKYFNIDKQISFSSLDFIDILPFSEFILKNFSDNIIYKQKYLKVYNKETFSLIDFLKNPVICYYEKNNILVEYDKLKKLIKDYSEEDNDNIKTDYMNNIDVVKGSNYISYSHFDNLDNNNNFVNHRYNFSNIEIFDGNFDKFKLYIENLLIKNKTLIFCIDNKEFINKIITLFEPNFYILTDVNNIITNKINIINFNIDEGFNFDDFYVFSMKNIFGLKNVKSNLHTKYKIGTKVNSILNLEIDDYVVHEFFGIGIYKGFVTLKKNGVNKDYIKLLYANDDLLYVPVENINRISKYSGKEGNNLKVSSLSNDVWTKKKKKISEKLQNLANDLLFVSSQRKKLSGFKFSSDDNNQIMFEDEFSFNETPDQLRACKIIKGAMESDEPMDMLLCGDVGYGKTEVAFRAMFKAVNDGKQVAYLCPTTILSKQQYESAVTRFSLFPIRIELINRYTSQQKKIEILNNLKDGKIDILFGTHCLLNDNIVYKDLGLLVVDEEQRFGVVHKEKIKKYKNTVDILTLSATPIPRTLQMSLTGLRGLALIETPPKERIPIQTYVLEESNLIIKDAIYKEISRNGQVFILFNNVSLIEEKANLISKLVPEAKIIYAHGQMSKDMLEDRMNDFISGKYDVLLCTTIIETGIDIPNVNTLIILDADRFGLSQLYQIRGRIGRSNKIGYAYLMYKKDRVLTSQAIKRLDTIKEFTQLGSGFKIAMRDLSIRGAGDILGSEQSGFIDSIGIDLYLKMLNNIINNNDQNLDNNIGKDESSLLNVSTHIDDSYVSDIDVKLIIHDLINKINSNETFDKIKFELENRFGKLPNEIIDYMYSEWFDFLAKKIGIVDIKDENRFVSFSLPTDLNNKIDGENLFKVSYKICKNFKLSFKNSHIIIILDKFNLEKSYLLYLIEFLNEIDKCFK